MMQANLYAHLTKKQPPQILVVEDDKEAQSAFHLAEYCYEKGILTKKPLVLPDFRAKKGEDLRSFQEEFLDLLVSLREFYAQDCFLIAPLSSVLYPLPKKELLEPFVISKEEPLDVRDLKEKLVHFGYEVVEIVEMDGEVSFRGDILDIAIPQDKSYRLSFFDIECESIREFDVQSQKSKTLELESLSIPPAVFHLSKEQYERMTEEIAGLDTDSFYKDIFSLGFWCLGDLGWEPLRQMHTILSLNAKNSLTEVFDFVSDSPYGKEFFLQLPSLQEQKDYADIRIEAKNLEYFLDLNADKPITILVPTQMLKEQFEARQIHAEISSLVVNISTPDCFIISLNQIQKSRKKQKPRIAINELNVGEYVVHIQYGIGVFGGIEQAKILGAVRDFIRIDYQGGDSLLLPVENLNLIDRYVAGSSGVPMMDRLGKGSFAKLKEKIKKKLFEIADSIISLAARRKLIEGKKIDTTLPEILFFKEQAGFVLTEDQERCIQEIFADMSSGQVMDRLLSGDVGFGKTEVAMNAIYAACQNGFQALMIVPTTLLALQHYHTLKERLKGLRVARLDRFVSARSKKGILQGLLEGKIDVVVGTHSLLGVGFKNLGLIVIDEEHKFGVKQKEAIKSLSKDVHLLSMSATPIPRTLNMALSQIKGMSSLLTPPSERQSTKTFVKEKSASLIKEVILRELRRNGQVFYIHNNIANIPMIERELKALLPQLEIALLHSQIDSNATEEILLSFAEKKTHLLLCTSIVESGIHLPNANTIIIDGADHFGLADLHQLRGRVGRGDREGFCYYLIDDRESITQEATKRLLALEKNSFLGSGAMIAYQDLEIRGGGNLLGEAQSGHIKNIGYNLYLKMLEDAIYQLSSNKEQIEERDVELKLQVSAYLDSHLISSDTLRLELYRRLSLCKDKECVYAIEGEIADRFGELDFYTKQFLKLILIKILARGLGITQISNFKKSITLFFGDGNKKFLQADEEEQILDEILKFLHKSRA
ncbi:transcription-repair coupling factor [Helicobacter mustelae]|uniref:transcription-repair coupling factor n=1 Tax=Helicobacter mustelae TaxID=217 RepID=UPI0015F054AB|nr:transcription-repair coupling factor [Helicobacter mustelae]